MRITSPRTEPMPEASQFQDIPVSISTSRCRTYCRSESSEIITRRAKAEPR